jgi:uncharacterized protein YbjT (DUF2867 family)
VSVLVIGATGFVGGAVASHLAATGHPVTGLARSDVTPDEAATVCCEFGALILGASSRSRAPRTRGELGWTPKHTDMLSMIR